MFKDVINLSFRSLGNANNLRVKVGEMRLSQNVGQRMAVAEVRKHRSYNSATINNDIAILTFTTQPTEGSNVMPACMPSRDHGVNEVSYVTGWGTTSEGKLLPLTTSLVW